MICESMGQRFREVLTIFFLLAGSLLWQVPAMGSNRPKEGSEISGLPLQICEPAMANDLPMMFYITGDGGWNSFSESLCRNLASEGVPVAALDARKYFWDPRQPDHAAKEIVDVIDRFAQKWKRNKVILAGYSFGAGIVPFIRNRVPDGQDWRLVVSILMAPDLTTDFTVHLADMLNLSLTKGKFDVTAEIKKGNPRNYLVIFNSGENKILSGSYQSTGAETLFLEGNHHFDSDTGKLAGVLFREIVKHSRDF